MADDAPEITVFRLPKFKAEATDPIGSDGIEALAVYLIDRPEAGRDSCYAKNAKRISRRVAPWPDCPRFQFYTRVFSPRIGNRVWSRAQALAVTFC
jgi:hypothetical protein